MFVLGVFWHKDSGMSIWGCWPAQQTQLFIAPLASEMTAKWHFVGKSKVKSLHSKVILLNICCRCSYPKKRDVLNLGAVFHCQLSLTFVKAFITTAGETSCFCLTNVATLLQSCLPSYRSSNALEKCSHRLHPFFQVVQINLTMGRKSLKDMWLQSTVGKLCPQWAASTNSPCRTLGYIKTSCPSLKLCQFQFKNCMWESYCEYKGVHLLPHTSSHRNNVLKHEC